MSFNIPFKNTYVALPEGLFSRQDPTPVRAPELIAFNTPLAKSLGMTGLDDVDTITRTLSGSMVPEGADPIAQMYAGHQFGNWNPTLGDGRAILLGETNGYDVQLKGSGPTPYSRRGDGRAWLGPVLREYVVSEAMHALGIPTTRALAAVSTGEDVIRETALPGAVLTRVASSHIRVGSFQALAARQDKRGLQALFEYAAARHYPEADTPAAFLAAVIDAQARLVSKWMSVGFIHGVMNTDNCAVSGETIDYGPCAFMDDFQQGKVFSSIDRQGRYAYGNQPDIIVWNMAQLAMALLSLETNTEQAAEHYTTLVHQMPNQIKAHWKHEFCRKIGIGDVQQDDEELIVDLLAIMQRQKSDFTNVFRSLSTGSAHEQFLDPSEFDVWHNKWDARLKTESSDPMRLMAMSNPAVIARNHQVEHMITSAVEDDFTAFHRLNDALSTPYSLSETHTDLTHTPQQHERVTQTFCGT